MHVSRPPVGGRRRGAAAVQDASIRALPIARCRLNEKNARHSGGVLRAAPRGFRRLRARWVAKNAVCLQHDGTHLMCQKYEGRLRIIRKKSDLVCRIQSERVVETVRYAIRSSVHGGRSGGLPDGLSHRWLPSVLSAACAAPAALRRAFIKMKHIERILRALLGCPACGHPTL